MDEKTPSGVTNYEMVKKTINDAVSSVQMQGASIAGAKTDSVRKLLSPTVVQCESSIEKKSTKCMEEIVLWHEDQVHMPSCKKDLAAGKTTAAGNWAPLTVTAYVMEEIAGYESEIARIRDVLKGMPPQCQHSGWVGTIYYFEETRVDTQAGSTQSSTVVKREARILYQEGSTHRVNAKIQDETTIRETKTARGACRGGLAGPVGPERITTFTSEDAGSTSGSAEADTDVTFIYDPQTGAYSLSFGMPEVSATGLSTLSENVAGSCDPQQDGTKTTLSRSSKAYEKSGFDTIGMVKPDADVIREEKTFDETPPVSIPGVTQSRKVTVSFVFYKVN